MKKALYTTLAVITIFSLLVGCSTQKITPDSKEETKLETEEISPEERKRVDLYVTVLKAAFNEENGGNGFIAVKLNTLTELSDQGKGEVLKELTGLAENVYSYEDVKNDKTKFEFDTEGRMVRTIDGALLWLEMEEYSEKEAIITGVSWFGNLGAVFPKYQASFQNGIWELKLIRMAVS